MSKKWQEALRSKLENFIDQGAAFSASSLSNLLNPMQPKKSPTTTNNNAAPVGSLTDVEISAAFRKQNVATLSPLNSKYSKPLNPPLSRQYAPSPNTTPNQQFNGYLNRGIAVEGSKKGNVAKNSLIQAKIWKSAPSQGIKNPQQWIASRFYSGNQVNNKQPGHPGYARDMSKANALKKQTVPQNKEKPWLQYGKTSSLVPSRTQMPLAQPKVPNSYEQTTVPGYLRTNVMANAFIKNNSPQNVYSYGQRTAQGYPKGNVISNAFNKQTVPRNHFTPYAQKVIPGYFKGNAMSYNAYARQDVTHNGFTPYGQKPVPGNIKENSMSSASAKQTTPHSYFISYGLKPIPGYFRGNVAAHNAPTKHEIPQNSFSSYGKKPLPEYPKGNVMYGAFAKQGISHNDFKSYGQKSIPGYFEGNGMPNNAFAKQEIPQNGLSSYGPKSAPVYSKDNSMYGAFVKQAVPHNDFKSYRQKAMPEYFKGNVMPNNAFTKQGIPQNTFSSYGKKAVPGYPQRDAMYTAFKKQDFPHNGFNSVGQKAMTGYFTGNMIPNALAKQKIPQSTFPLYSPKTLPDFFKGNYMSNTFSKQAVTHSDLINNRKKTVPGYFKENIISNAFSKQMVPQNHIAFYTKKTASGYFKGNSMPSNAFAKQEIPQSAFASYRQNTAHGYFKGNVMSNAVTRQSVPHNEVGSFDNFYNPTSFIPIQAPVHGSTPYSFTHSKITGVPRYQLTTFNKQIIPHAQVISSSSYGNSLNLLPKQIQSQSLQANFVKSISTNWNWSNKGLPYSNAVSSPVVTQRSTVYPSQQLGTFYMYNNNQTPQQITRSSITSPPSSQNQILTKTSSSHATKTSSLRTPSSPSVNSTSYSNNSTSSATPLRRQMILPAPTQLCSPYQYNPYNPACQYYNSYQPLGTYSSPSFPTVTLFGSILFPGTNSYEQYGQIAQPTSFSPCDTCSTVTCDNMNCMGCNVCLPPLAKIKGNILLLNFCDLA